MGKYTFCVKMIPSDDIPCIMYWRRKDAYDPTEALWKEDKESIRKEEFSMTGDLGPHKCPVCGEYEFPKFDTLEACPVCGWIDHWRDEEYPDVKGLHNHVPLNELIRIFKEKELAQKAAEAWWESDKRKMSMKVDDMDAYYGPHKCPVCGEHEFPKLDSYEFCPVCGWCDHWRDEDYPDRKGECNHISLNEKRRIFREQRAKQEKEQ